MATPVLESAMGASTPRRRALDHLKRHANSTLAEIAASLGVTKAAALRHLTSLEGAGLVSRSTPSAGVGRPPARFRLTNESTHYFPEAYTQMSTSALAFIDRELGRAAVVQLLQERSAEVGEAAAPRLRGRPLPERIGELARIREEGGYMAEVGARRRGSTELLENNCPILAIASQFPEACEVERQLFERMLKANVASEHRMAAGHPVCRFLIRPRPQEISRDR
ncbi:MAG: MarR family transcriptional regulator [Thermoplasmata archaeon]|nr:MarR family transcriptional regulator [Thermoplasmata archaeon]